MTSTGKHSLFWLFDSLLLPAGTAAGIATTPGWVLPSRLIFGLYFSDSSVDKNFACIYKNFIGWPNSIPCCARVDNKERWF